MGELCTEFAQQWDINESILDKKQTRKYKSATEDAGRTKHARGERPDRVDRAEGKRKWRQDRVVVKSKPEQEIELAPGQTEMIEIMINNATYQPNKKGCKITFADEQPSGNVPLNHLQYVCEQDVPGQTDATFHVPITMGDHIAADGHVFEVNLVFREK